MIPALKHKDKILKEFYLADDDMTIKRATDGYYDRFKKHDVVIPFKYKGAKGYNYYGVHIPKTRSTISVPWLLTVLRGVTFEDNQVIDHKDGNTDNNTRSNLRVVSQNVNSKNRKKHSNNTSGYTGVHWNASAKLYMIRRAIKGKRIYRSSKTLEGALTHLEELKQLGLADGYSKRHGK